MRCPAISPWSLSMTTRWPSLIDSKSGSVGSGLRQGMIESEPRGDSSEKEKQPRERRSSQCCFNSSTGERHRGSRKPASTLFFARELGFHSKNDRADKSRDFSPPLAAYLASRSSKECVVLSSLLNNPIKQFVAILRGRELG